MLTSEDTIFNERALRKKGDAYIVRSYAVEPVLTPELNMWFPRITSRDPPTSHASPTGQGWKKAT